MDIATPKEKLFLRAVALTFTLEDRIASRKSLFRRFPVPCPASYPSVEAVRVVAGETNPIGRREGVWQRLKLQSDGL